VVVEHGTAHVQPLEQVLSPSLLWVMDFNLRRTACSTAQTTDVVFLGHYGDQIALAEGATSGSYLSPAYDWGGPARTQEVTVAAELNGAQASVSIETSDDGFVTTVAGAAVPLRDGVHSYAVGGVPGRSVRVRFNLLRLAPTAASPVVDGFRVTAE
jgi:hypothetical protein